MTDLKITNSKEFDEFWLDGLRLLHLSEDGAGPQPGPEVWWCYAAKDDGHRVDLLIEPGELSQFATRQIVRRFHDTQHDLNAANLAQGFGFLTIELTLTEFVQILLPLTDFSRLLTWLTQEQSSIGSAMRCYRQRTGTPEAQRRGWFAYLLLAVSRPRTKAGKLARLAPTKTAITHLRQLATGAAAGSLRKVRRVAINRPVRPAVARSTRTVKADAAARLFGVSCRQVRWAIIDSGIDARHPEFRAHLPSGDPYPEPFEYTDDAGETQHRNCTRVDETYDFTQFRAGRRLGDVPTAERPRRSVSTPQIDQSDTMLPHDVPVPMNSGAAAYRPPEHGHGTHVAGIVGGASGMCRDIRLVDFRVLGADGSGDEFAVLAALRYIRDRNQLHRDQTRSGRTRDLFIHGVNLSLTLDPDVSSDACGWSLVCRACDELVRSGVVVVVAAGNAGHETSWGQQRELYSHTTRTVSIADPGNADRVITVGSTNPDRPHEYGVSYFSARGPTADGRLKPDLVAPGEDIRSAHGYMTGDHDIDGAMLSRNGTSQAAAHVSGAAAMLLARNSELVGKPDDVKRILCDTATDLGRDRTFQGRGLLDTLRALQEI